MLVIEHLERVADRAGRERFRLALHAVEIGQPLLEARLRRLQPATQRRPRIGRRSHLALATQRRCQSVERVIVPALQRCRRHGRGRRAGTCRQQQRTENEPRTGNGQRTENGQVGGRRARGIDRSPTHRVR